MIFGKLRASDVFVSSLGLSKMFELPAVSCRLSHFEWLKRSTLLWFAHATHSTLFRRLNENLLTMFSEFHLWRIYYTLFHFIWDGFWFSSESSILKIPKIGIFSSFKREIDFQRERLFFLFKSKWYFSAWKLLLDFAGKSSARYVAETFQCLHCALCSRTGKPHLI